MAGESTEKCAWVPQTPAKSGPAVLGVKIAGFDLNNHEAGLVENPQLAQVLGKLRDEGFYGAVNSVGTNLECWGLNGKPEAIIIGISDNRPALETTEVEVGKALDESIIQTPKKRKQVKRVKVKKHRPKVFDRTKVVKKPSTPKPKTPKPPTPKKRTKLVKKDSLKTSVEPSKDVDPEASGSNKKTCRRELDFNIENLIINESLKVPDTIEAKPEVEPKLQPSDRALIVYQRKPKRKPSDRPIVVYRRLFSCLKSSRKLGPNCPFTFKKARMRRLRAAMFDKFIKPLSMIPITRKQKRACLSEPLNLDQILRNRKTKSRSLSRRKDMTKGAVKPPSVDKCALDLSRIVRRKRSNSSIRRKRDLSSFVKDLSKLLFSETFLSRASDIRAQAGCDKLAANVEVQDEHIQLVDQNELRQDDMVSPNEDILKCSEDIEDCMRELKMDSPKHVSKIDVLNFRSEESVDSDVSTPCSDLCDIEDFPSPSRVMYNDFARENYNHFTAAMVDFASQKMDSLNINDECDQLVVRYQKNEIIPSKEKFDQPKKREQPPRIDFYEEAVRVSNLLTEKGENIDTEQTEADEKEKKFWEEERNFYEGRLAEFVAIMNLIQGDKRFSRWKGSVVDSVVGVFLTQNVSDHLSSSAFMSLAAKYPPPPPPPYVNKPNVSDFKIDSTIQDREQLRIAEPPSNEPGQLVTIENGPISIPSNLNDGSKISSQPDSTPGKRKGKAEEKQETIDWDELRKKYSRGVSRTDLNADSVDWEAIRRGSVNELAQVIMDRGMNNLLAGRIKDFLDRLVRDHGSIDLEWLRDVPPETAKDYLLSITGLGLKSVECVRLLALFHCAFPVDVNIARFATRYGWVPLLLPVGVELHLLNQYPDLDSVQKFLWPRIKNLSHAKLFEVHYHLILFGKTICTKKNPNCKACPLKAKCRHYASMTASAKPHLNGPSRGEKNTASTSSVGPDQDPVVNSRNPPMLTNNDNDSFTGSNNNDNPRNCEPIIEMPASPVAGCAETQEEETEDYNYVCEDEIPTIKLNGEAPTENAQSLTSREDDGASQALVTIHPKAASILMAKLMNVERLRTVHHVYELPDLHPLLAGFERRVPEDPCPYLLAIWMTDETTNPRQDPRKANNCQESTKSNTCTCSGEIVKHQNDRIVHGTVLIPCRSANRGYFPLSGTYFQVNEMFADHESSREPIAVPREWVWNLRRRALYCATSVHSVCRDMEMVEVQYCFVNGFICIRGFDKITRGPKPLARRFHICKTRQVDKE